MPGQNRHRLLGWHAEPDIHAYVEAEAERRKVPKAVILSEALRQAMTSGAFTCPTCQHKNTDPLDVREGFCARCGQVTHPEKLAELRRLTG